MNTRAEYSFLRKCITGNAEDTESQQEQSFRNYQTGDTSSEMFRMMIMLCAAAAAVILFKSGSLEDAIGIKPV